MSERIHARLVMQRRVEFRHAQGHGDGMLMNLSLRGWRIKGASSFLCGTRLRLQLWLPDQAHPLEVEQAIVGWMKDDQFGLSFLDVPPEVRVRLAGVFQLLHEAQQPEEKMIPKGEPPSITYWRTYAPSGFYGFLDRTQIMSILVPETINRASQATHAPEFTPVLTQNSSHEKWDATATYAFQRYPL